MKTAGFLIFALGLLVTIFSGLTYVTREIMIDSSNLGLARAQDPAISWLPLVGVAIMVTGAAFFATGIRRRDSHPQL